MKTKAQKEFLKQRRQYEKQLKEKAKNDELSLPEKLEWHKCHEITIGRNSLGILKLIFLP